MRDDIGGFWRTLLVRLHEARHGGDLPPEEAERRMARSVRAPLSARRIDEIVASVTGGEARGEASPREEGGSDGHLRTPDVVPRRRPRVLFASHRLAAALLVVGVVGLLVAGRLLIWPPVRYPTQTMSYPLAVRLSLDPGQPTEVRIPALGRTFGGVKLGLRCLFELEQDASLGERARALRAELRAALAGPPDEPRIPDGDLSAVSMLCLDRGARAAVRREAMEQAAKRTQEGIATLRRLEDEPGRLGRFARIYVAKVRDDLAR